MALSLRTVRLAFAGLLLLPAACSGRTNAADDAGLPVPASDDTSVDPGSAPTGRTDPLPEEEPDPSTLMDAGTDADAPASDASTDAGDAGRGMGTYKTCTAESVVVPPTGFDARATPFPFAAPGDAVAKGALFLRSTCGALAQGQKVYLSFRLRPTTKSYRWGAQGAISILAAVGGDALGDPNKLRFSTTEDFVWEITAKGKTEFALRLDESDSPP
jgi:hypothetical protein